MTLSPSFWTATSWKHYPQSQEIIYSNLDELEQVTTKLRLCPPVVPTIEQIDSLQENLLQVANSGDSFIVQGGDCAESFENSMKRYRDLVSLFGEIESVLKQNGMSKVVKIARAAGQFAKPRAVLREIVDGIDVCAFRGFSINGLELHEREPDPNRLIQAYQHSTKVFDFMHKIDETIYTSHEALSLDYESSLVTQCSDSFYDLSCHFPWLGHRTRNIFGAHTHFLSGLANPIGVKVGPDISGNDLVALIQTLNPQNTPFKITLITRYGVDNLQTIYSHIAAIKTSNLKVLWICDPMHGNTRKDKQKTRHFCDLVKESVFIAEALKSEGLRLHGIHLEMAGDDGIYGKIFSFLECFDECSNRDINYRSPCDPRLNRTQTLRLIDEILPHILT